MKPGNYLLDRKEGQSHKSGPRRVARVEVPVGRIGEVGNPGRAPKVVKVNLSSKKHIVDKSANVKRGSGGKIEIVVPVSEEEAGEENAEEEDYLEAPIRHTHDLNTTAIPTIIRRTPANRADETCSPKKKVETKRIRM